MTSRGQSQFKRLDAKLDAALRKRNIHPISNYGWLDAYTADPELIGHAMWQTSPPIDFIPAQEETLGEPTDLQKRLTVVGADFEGLMELSRTSLGVVLWRKTETLTDYFSDHAKYWAHYTGTLLSLSMASDRLRDFFVIAYFETTYSSYRNLKYEFKSPFLEAKSISHAELDEQLTKLLPLIEEVQRNRSVRNNIVHRIATRPGKMNEEVLSSRRRATPQADRDDLKGAWDQWIGKVNREVADSAEFVAAWYETLVNASSLIFEIEHLLRRERLRKADRRAT